MHCRVVQSDRYKDCVHTSVKSTDPPPRWPSFTSTAVLLQAWSAFLGGRCPKHPVFVGAIVPLLFGPDVCVNAHLQTISGTRNIYCQSMLEIQFKHVGCCITLDIKTLDNSPQTGSWRRIRTFSWLLRLPLTDHVGSTYIAIGESCIPARTLIDIDETRFVYSILTRCSLSALKW